MGLLDRLGLTKSRIEQLASPTDFGGSVNLGVASPWQEGSLGVFGIADDILPTDVASKLPLSREAAIQIPAVAKSRNLLVATVMRFPLVALPTNSETPLNPQPAWLTRTNLGVSPSDRMAATIDDLIFYGCSLWVVERGALGQVISAAWIPKRRWEITGGNILVDEKPMSDEQLLLFNAPFDGLLIEASRTMRGARAIESAWVKRAQNPIVATELHITDDLRMTQEEADAYVASWMKKYGSEDGVIVGTTPSNIEMIDHGTADPQMYVEARNAVRTDIAGFLGLNAEIIDGTVSDVASLTYSTKDGQKNAFYELSLPFWLIPIESRLSLDDVVPRGQRVRFDKYGTYNTFEATPIVDEPAPGAATPDASTPADPADTNISTNTEAFHA